MECIVEKLLQAIQIQFSDLSPSDSQTGQMTKET